ncbi:MAG: NADH-quinone oxidoreductase subunit D [Candidatus Eisenbacteria bacterium]|uniref:NADH-quinone oxidoreductase subunit D n=1 Tax=Eiseniibacteriota bacterium TaxID=2212470 RepID=A0A948RRD3_UNCEI|nr:NADH-quinone oxidoreductase subunit D [Candidatus Eisenbacteria bacterium]MBU1949247.1 NADH-quinone oxidoreductase subunit D [Candidatus Eisenbacteria bacterium]MBU2689585.1 NADH-quinone oxidoreductase subunit D [Candidatus Eisenbacteria bacterium]
MLPRKPIEASQTSPKVDTKTLEFNPSRVPQSPEDFGTDEMLINMGPQHPSTHGVLRVEITTDGEIIKKARPFIGYLHRCFEKCSELVGYPGTMPYTDRMDYLASMNCNHGYALAVEKLMGLEVPERAEYIRVIIAELGRIASHLVSFGSYALDLGAVTPIIYAFREREVILNIFEAVCGARLTYNYYRIGGVSGDLTPKMIDMIRDFVDYFEPKLIDYDNLLSYNKIFIERTANVGVIPLDMAINYGLTGPMLRGSGMKWDLRKNDPYSIYDRFDFNIPVGTGAQGQLGDCWDRYIVRMREMKESCKIIRQAIERIPAGAAIAENIPKIIKPPKGEVYVRVENPRGEMGYYIISDGSAKAYRCKARSASFANLAILQAIAPGVMLADLVAIIGSIDIVLGDVDR